MGRVCIEAAEPGRVQVSKSQTLIRGSGLPQPPTSYPDEYHQAPLKHKQDAKKVLTEGKVPGWKFTCSEDSFLITFTFALTTFEV